MLDSLVAPAHHWCPPYEKTYGPEVVELAATVGLVLDANQAACLDDMFSIRPGTAMTWNVIEDATVCDRQNLKTVTLQAAALAKLVLFEDSLVVWTAHEYPTAQEAFRDIKPWFTDYDHISRLLRGKPLEGKGDESIELRSGGRLIFRARTKHGGRGISGDTVILDEGQKLTPANMGALVPTISARQRSQLLYGGTAGDRFADVFRRIRDRGRAGGDPRLAYREWCAPRVACDRTPCTHIDEPGCALDNWDLIRAANPSLGLPGRLREEVILTERQTLPPAEFMRERMGWWEEPEDFLSAIDPEQWEALADPDAEPTSPTFSVSTGPDHEWTAIGVAWSRPGGTQVMVSAGDSLDYRPPGAWVRERVNELRAKWGGTVVVDTASRGMVDGAVELTSAAQAIAHNAFAAAVADSLVHHGNQPALNVAVKHSKWHPTGDTRVLDRKSEFDITPLVAVALAASQVGQGVSVYEERGLMSL